MRQLRLACSNDLRQKFGMRRKRFEKCGALPPSSLPLPPVVEKVWLLLAKRPHGAEVVEELIDRLLLDVK